jgi:methionyl-tRNA formyltransferase/RimJ/RimL family protein N-acetyltransferase
MKVYLLVLRAFGLCALLVELANSVVTRFGVSRIERLYQLTSWPAGLVPQPTDYTVRLLSVDELKREIVAGFDRVSSEDLYRIEMGRAICFGAFSGERLVAVCWYALRPYHHSDGVYACFSPEWICGYGLWIHPDHRGGGIRPQIVRTALEYAHSIGRRGILAAIDWNNFASIRSGLKLGYQAVGLRYWSQRRPFRTRPLYWHSWPASGLDTVSTDRPHAFITPFESPALTAAFASGQLVLVIGCGNDILEPWCVSREIRYLRYNAEDPAATAAALGDSGALFLVSYAAPLLPAEVFTAPPMGSFNIHPSLLPDYRGGLPIFWQVFDGHQESGITLHHIDAGIDTGAIVSQRHFEIPCGLTGNQYRQHIRDHVMVLFKELLYSVDLSALPLIKRAPTEGVRGFAPNVTLRALLARVPVADMSVEQLYRLVCYIGHWPPLLADLPPGARGLPLKVVDAVLDDDVTALGFHRVQGQLRFGTRDGYLVFAQPLTLRGLAKAAKKRLSPSATPSDVHL